MEYNTTETGNSILGSLYKLTDPEMGRGATGNKAAKEALQTILQFYEFEHKQKLLGRTESTSHIL